MSPEGFEDTPVPVRPLDEDQARLLEMLRAAAGKPVPFSELRSRGIDNPAVLCYELEIAGVPITHVERPRRGAAAVPVGVQLDAGWFAAPAAAAQDPPWRERCDAGLARAHQTWTKGFSAGSGALAGFLTRGRGALARMRARVDDMDTGWDVLSPRQTRAGLLVGAAALAVVIALAIALGSGSGAHRGSAGLAGAQKRAHLAGLRGSTGTGGTAHHAQTRRQSTSDSAGTSAGHSTSVGEGGGRATQLQAEGHQLLAEGHYAAAAADLRAAIAASGGSPARCQEPSTESCLAYAYALYDLGRALQAQDKPGQAVPVLNERLHIDNQRQTVRAQLHSARSQMHAAGPHPRSRRSRAKAHRQQHPSASSPHPNATPSPGGPEATGEQPQPPSEGGAGEGPKSPGSPTHGGAQGPPITND